MAMLNNRNLIYIYIYSVELCTFTPYTQFNPYLQICMNPLIINNHMVTISTSVTVYYSQYIIQHYNHIINHIIQTFNYYYISYHHYIILNYYY